MAYFLIEGSEYSQAIQLLKQNSQPENVLDCICLMQSQGGHSLSSRADFPDSTALLRAIERLTQPLLVFVSIKGKEEAFLLRERLASESRLPVTQCCTLREKQHAELRTSELCRRSHELNCPL